MNIKKVDIVSLTINENSTHMTCLSSQLLAMLLLLSEANNDIRVHMHVITYRATSLPNALVGKVLQSDMPIHPFVYTISLEQTDLRP